MFSVGYFCRGFDDPLHLILNDLGSSNLGVQLVLAPYDHNSNDDRMTGPLAPGVRINRIIAGPKRNEFIEMRSSFPSG